MSDFLFSKAIEEDGSLVDESEDEIETVSNNDFIDDTEIDDSVEDQVNVLPFSMKKLKMPI